MDLPGPFQLRAPSTNPWLWLHTFSVHCSPSSHNKIFCNEIGCYNSDPLEKMILIPDTMGESKFWCSKQATYRARATSLQRRHSWETTTLDQSCWKQIGQDQYLGHLCGEFLIEVTNEIIGEGGRKGKTGSDDRQPLNNIQNNFLLNKRNTLHRLRWKCNFGAVDKGSVSDMCSFWKNRGICFLILQTVCAISEGIGGWLSPGSGKCILLSSHEGALKRARKSILIGQGSLGEMTSL